MQITPASYTKSAKISTAKHVLEALDRADDENRTIQIIKEALLSEEHRKALYDNNLDIADLLNGRTTQEQTEKVKNPIFHDWNQKLGQKHFGFSGMSDPYECFPPNERPTNYKHDVDPEVDRLIEELKKQVLAHRIKPLALNEILCKVGYFEDFCICEQNRIRQGNFDPYK